MSRHASPYQHRVAHPRRHSKMFLIPILVLCCVGSTDGHSLPRSSGWGYAEATVPSAAAPFRRPDVLETYSRLPLQFEANQGQTDSQVKFLARGSGYAVFLTASEAVLVLPSSQASAQTPLPVVPGLDRRTRGQRERQSPPERGATVVRLSLVGANPETDMAGLEPLPGKGNYFLGNDPRKWRTDVPTYAKIRYRDVYPGVDVVYYGAQRRLEYDFVVAPGADPTRITLAVTGAETLAVDAAGDLVLQTPSGALRLHKPQIYQEVGGVKRQIAGGYVLLGQRQVGLRVAAYDARRPLVIDPVLSYSTYLGGGSYDYGFGIAVDSAGNAYVTGHTASLDFPTANALQPALGGSVDAFVAKLNAAGSALVYSTYLGGNSDDYGAGIAVDSAGNAYVTGTTYSSDFPTVNALQPTLGGSSDAFVAKLNVAGSALVYSTYLGGSDYYYYYCDYYSEYCWDGYLGDFGSRIAVDAGGNAYVTGTTYSSDFPTANALQPTFGGCDGCTDAFVAKLNAAGSALAYSTYLGGNSDDYGAGIAVDSAGNAYVTGYTSSSDFPTANALQPTFGGYSDAFLAKLNPAGSALVYSTYLGGNSDDAGTGIAVDSAGNAYVTGYTSSSDLPTANALQPTLAGSYDAFVAKLDAAGSALVYSTYLGGSDSDAGYGIAADSAGNAYVTGTTYSPDFPTANALQPTLGGCPATFVCPDAFVAKLDATGSALVYSTYLGGGNYELGSGIAVDSAGNAYVTGETYSLDFPTANALQPTFAGSPSYGDAFVAKISTTLTALNPVPTLTSLSPTSAKVGGPGFTLTLTGTNFVSNSVGQWNGGARATTFISTTQLQVSIPASDIASAGIAQVTVFNSAPGGGTSNSLAFRTPPPKSREKGKLPRR